MMTPNETHSRFAVVWLDHKEARVLFLHREDPSFDAQVVHAPHSNDDARHANGRRHHVASDDAYFADVSKAMAGATDVWLVGPADAKTELMGYLERHHRNLQAAVKGTERVDHPTNGELAESGRRFFEKLVAPRQVFVRA